MNLQDVERNSATSQFNVSANRFRWKARIFGNLRYRDDIPRHLTLWRAEMVSAMGDGDLPTLKACRLVS